MVKMVPGICPVHGMAVIKLSGYARCSKLESNQICVKVNVFANGTFSYISTRPFTSSWRHRQSCLCDLLSWCAVHGHEHPNSDGDHDEPLMKIKNES